MRRDELSQVMGHLGLKIGLNEKRFTAQVFSQYHGAVQPHTAIPRLTIAPLRLHTTCADRHWAWGKAASKSRPPKSS